jgi:hypothetical protein
MSAFEDTDELVAASSLNVLYMACTQQRSRRGMSKSSVVEES